MALNRRQRRLYEHTMRVWRPTSRNGSGDFVYTVHIESAPCYFFTTTNTDRPGAHVGLVKQDNIFTYDNVHFEALLDVNGQDVVQQMTQGHPEFGKYFKLTGEPDVHTATSRRNTNFAHAFLNKTTPPPMEGVAV